MKRFFFFCMLWISAISAIAQTPSYQQKLYYTCKVWGFVKFYHSNVSNCHVDWDSVLIATLPKVKAAATDSEFNDALDTMLAAAGPMALSSTPFPDTLPTELKRNRNFGWISSSVFRSDVQTILDTIKNNFRPHPICYVENNPYTSTNYGWLIFPMDTTLLNVNAYTSFPDEPHRLLLLFKHWNIMNYFNPYNYVLDHPIDTILSNSVLNYANANNYDQLIHAIFRMTSQFNDAHVQVLTYSYYDAFPYRAGYYYPKILVKYIENKYIVVKTGVSGLNIGDEITSIDGLTPVQWEDSLREYMSDGNPAVFRRDLINCMFSGPYGSVISIHYNDSTGSAHTLTASRSIYLSDSWFPNFYYPDDSLNNITWTTMGCNTGYVNIGNMPDSQVTPMYSALYDKPAIIFDVRNYPMNSSAWYIANLMYPNSTIFAKFTTPDVTYPGTFYWNRDSLGVNNNPSPYTGQVIILVNQETQSAAEFSSMILRAIPNAIVMGSQTAGTDGNVSYFNLTQYIRSGFTSLGTFYANGDSTERIGIVPDSVVTPTIAGIRHGQDEVLNRALALACSLSVSNVNKTNNAVHIYPNPATDIVHVDISNTKATDISITISDITGKTITSKETRPYQNEVNADFDVHQYAPGLYLVTIKNGTSPMQTLKFVKQ